MNRLEEIIANKRREVEGLRPRAAELKNKAVLCDKRRGFGAALQRADHQLAVIAEIKKASPSAGLIAASFNPVQRAKEYECAGADAISVLTDEPFFQGSLADLIAVRDVVTIPVLRKDFILDEIQIYEAIAAGADAILLIVAALTNQQLRHLWHTADQRGLDVLVEVHSADELDRALAIEPDIIGINNRDLATFRVDLSVTEALSDSVPEHIILVSESGFKTADDVCRAEACGVDAILMGEALMRGNIKLEIGRAHV